MNDGDEYLISPERSKAEEIFDGAHNTEEAKSTSGVATVVDHETGLKRQQKHKVVSANIDYRRKQFGLLDNKAAIDFVLGYEIQTKDITREILKLRTIKQKAEVDEIKNGCCTYPDAQDKQDTAEILNLGGIAAVGVGGAMIVGGILMFALSGDDEEMDVSAGVSREGFMLQWRTRF